MTKWESVLKSKDAIIPSFIWLVKASIIQNKVMHVHVIKKILLLQISMVLKLAVMRIAS